MAGKERSKMKDNAPKRCWRKLLAKNGPSNLLYVAQGSGPQLVLRDQGWLTKPPQNLGPEP